MQRTCQSGVYAAQLLVLTTDSGPGVEAPRTWTAPVRPCHRHRLISAKHSIYIPCSRTQYWDVGKGHHSCLLTDVALHCKCSPTVLYASHILPLRTWKHTLTHCQHGPHNINPSHRAECNRIMLQTNQYQVARYSGIRITSEDSSGDLFLSLSHTDARSPR